MGMWTAEFSNDPENDYNIYVELLEDDEYKARLYCDKDETLLLRFYGGNGGILPIDWLSKIVEELGDIHGKKSQPNSDELR